MQLYPTLLSKSYDPLKFWQAQYQQTDIANGVNLFLKKIEGMSETPTIVFDRAGVIYHVNNSYKNLTSWNQSLPYVPTSMSDFDVSSFM
jgi:hypothetical protein